MPFDPFGIDAYHAKVRENIAGGLEGFAQSEVDDILVSYEVGHSITHGPVLSKPIAKILDEMILDVARGEGVAGPKTFLTSRVRFAVDDRREFPEHRLKKHKEADDIEAFYFGGAGSALLRD